MQSVVCFYFEVQPAPFPVAPCLKMGAARYGTVAERERRAVGSVVCTQSTTNASRSWETKHKCPRCGQQQQQSSSEPFLLSVDKHRRRETNEWSCFLPCWNSTSLWHWSKSEVNTLKCFFSSSVMTQSVFRCTVLFSFFLSPYFFVSSCKLHFSLGWHCGRRNFSVKCVEMLFFLCGIKEQSVWCCSVWQFQKRSCSVVIRGAVIERAVVFPSAIIPVFPVGSACQQYSGVVVETT